MELSIDTGRTVRRVTPSSGPSKMDLSMTCSLKLLLQVSGELLRQYPLVLMTIQNARNFPPNYKSSGRKIGSRKPRGRTNGNSPVSRKPLTHLLQRKVGRSPRRL
jgi:hypothetical protein